MLKRILLLVCVLLPAAAWAVTDACPPFYLRTDTGAVINPITGENADQPYSTRKTCGACHDVDTISKGYHFNMDWDKADDHRFADTPTPWLVSTGLTGSMTPYGYYFLAKKKNSHPDQIDLTVFDFVGRSPGKKKDFQIPTCGSCHPGGGALEFDRDGQRYDKRLAQLPDLASSLDGDYYNSQWDKSGVVEPDCFICHSGRYSIQARIIQLAGLNFKWATVAASGIGRVTGTVRKGENPKVIYNRRLFNEDGKFYMPDMVFKPKPKNCLICHESIELGKRGFSWDDHKSPDVHQWAGLGCVDCHFGDIGHNFAKGNAMASTVADDQDNSMRTCRDCHDTGYRGATPMRHVKIKKDHLDKLSCEACHIPKVSRSAVGAMIVATGRFGKIGQPGTKRFGDHKSWQPAYVIRAKDRDKKPRITPVNPFYASLFTNLDSDGIHYPLFLSEIGRAYESCKDRLSEKTRSHDFHDSEDIRVMLETLGQTLKTNQRFKQVSLFFHHGRNIVSLNESGMLVTKPDTTWVARIPCFSVSHNVAPANQALGAGGCRDCHAKGAHLFGGEVITNYFGKDGTPETVVMADFIGLPKTVQVWNRFFSTWLDLALPVFAVLLTGLCLAGGWRVYTNRRHDLAPVRTFAAPVGVIGCLAAGHVILTRDWGLLLRLAEISWVVTAVGIILLLAGLVIAWQGVKKKVKNPGRLLAHAVAAGLAMACGLAIWIFSIDHAGLRLILSGLHLILAPMVLIIVIVVLIRPDKQ